MKTPLEELIEENLDALKINKSRIRSEFKEDNRSPLFEQENYKKEYIDRKIIDNIFIEYLNHHKFDIKEEKQGDFTKFSSDIFIINTKELKGLIESLIRTMPKELLSEILQRNI